MLTIETKKLEISKDLLMNVGMTCKFVCVKPTITGKEVKINKQIYDTLKKFMNTSKRVINCKIC